MSLRIRSILLVSLFILTANLALGAVLIRQARNATKTQINERMLDIVNTAAAMLDGDVLKNLTAQDSDTPQYQEVLDILRRFLDNIELNYIYYVRDMGNKTFTFGIDPDPVSPGEFGSPVVYTEAMYEASQRKPSVDEVPYIEEMNGTISVESEKDVGSTFTVMVTLRNSIHQGMDKEDTIEPKKMRASLEGRCILLAEDIEMNAEIIIDILDMESITTDHAKNGRIAVEMFQKSAPGTYSAILMEVRMPEMDGLEATAAIRALDRPDARQIPIIALTANAFDEDVQRSLQAGMNAYLSKPVEPEYLYKTLGELIYEAESEPS